VEHWEAAQAAPLSARKLALVCGLADAYADRLFGEQPDADDILEFRRGLAGLSPELGLCFAVVRGDAKLVTEAVQVPLSDYGQLRVEDFMVSLYNDHSVQRVRIALADGTRLMAHHVVERAVRFLSSG
jgi:hypothetical protein